MVIKMNGASIAVYRMCLGALLCMTNPPTSHAYPFSPRGYLPMRL